MNADRYQLLGLAGFILSGLFFLLSGILNGDFLTFAGSLVWIIACIVWIVPLLQDTDKK
ncbi:MAG: hypothetical protein R6V54_03840 [Desulfobacteraceae bacterium]